MADLQDLTDEELADAILEAFHVGEEKIIAALFDEKRRRKEAIN